MATNVLGSAFIVIKPQLLLDNGITIRISRGLEGAADAAGGLRDELDGAADAARRAAGDVEDVADAAGEAGDAARRAADDVEDVGDAAEDAAGDADTLGDRLDEAGDAAADAADQAESGWTGAFTNIKSGVTVGFLALGATAAAAFGVGLAQAMDAEAASDKLAAQLGLGAEDAAKVARVSASIYTSAWGDSTETVNEAIRGVYANIGDGNEEWLRDTAEKAVAVADIWGQEVGGVTAAVGKLLSTGLAQSADEAFDIIAAGFQSGNDLAGDWLDTLNEYSVQWERVGLDGATAAGLISQAIQAGARDSDQVADALGQFGELALSGAQPVRDAFTSIGLDADEMARKIGQGGPETAAALQTTLDALRGTTDESVKLNAAVALFGDPGAVMGDALFAMNPAALAASQGIDTMTGSLDRAMETAGSNAASSLESLKRTFMTQLGDIGAVVLPPLVSLATTIATGIEPAIRVAVVAVSWLVTGLGVLSSFITGTVGPALVSFAGWVRDNQTPIMIVAGVITAVLLPALIQAGIQATIAAVKQVAAWTVTGAAAVKNAAIQTVALVVSGAKWVWAGWVAAGSAARQVAAWVVIGARAVAGAAVQVGALVMTGARWLWAGVQATASAARQVAAWVMVGARAAAGMAVQVGALVATGARWAWVGAQAMANAVRIAAAWLISLGPIGLIIAAVAGVVAGFVILWKKSEGFRNFWIGLWNVIKGAVLFVWDWIKSNWPTLLAILTGPIGIAVGLIVKHWDTIKGAVMAVVGWVKTNWPLLLAIITGPIGLAVLAVVKNWDTIKNAGIAVWNWIAALPGKIVSALASLGQTIAAPFVTAFNTVNSWILSAVGWFTALPGRIMSAVVSIGTVLVQPFVIGWNAVSSWITTAVGWFIALPGRLVAALATVWTVLSQPFITGWNIVSGWITTAMGWVGGIPGRVASALSGIASTVSQPFVNGWNTVSSAITTAVGWFTGLPGRITSALAGVGSAVSGPFKTGFNAVASAWNRGPGAISFSIPSWVPGLGGKSWSIPDIPLLARGGLITRGGFAITGENGPELGFWPAGAAVAPLDRAGTLLSGLDPARRGVTVHQTFTVDARGATDPAAFEQAMRRVVDQAETRLVRDLATMLGQGVGAR